MDDTHYRRYLRLNNSKSLPKDGAYFFAMWDISTVRMLSYTSVELRVASPRRADCAHVARRLRTRAYRHSTASHSKHRDDRSAILLTRVIALLPLLLINHCSLKVNKVSFI